MIHESNRPKLTWLRWVAFLEGASFLLLLCVAMPLKYMAGEPAMVRIVGMTHGLLFLAYLGLVILARDSRGWDGKTTLLALVASVIPAGTFWADVRIFRK